MEQGTAVTRTNPHDGRWLSGMREFAAPIYVRCLARLVLVQRGLAGLGDFLAVLLAVLFGLGRRLLLGQHLVALRLGLFDDVRRAELAIVKLLLHLGRLCGNHLGVGDDLALWKVDAR